MQKNDGTLRLQPTLTEIGKKRLLENRFYVSKIALADDGINYKLINPNIIDPELAVKRSPLLSVWKDSSFNLNNKIIVNNSETYLSEKDFKVSISNVDDEIKVYPKGFGKEIDFPRFIKEDEVVTIQYYITSNEISKRKPRISMSFSSQNIEGEIFNGRNFDKLKILSATLEDTRYFDFIVDPNNVHSNILHYKNFTEAFQTDDIKHNFPKTVNIYTGSSNESENSFYLKYKGNFRYEKMDKELYETSLTLMSEYSGRIQKIKLQIIPTSRQTEE